MNFKNIKIKLLLLYSFVITLIISIFSYILLDQFYKQNINRVDTMLITVINEINYNKHFYKPYNSNEFMIKNLYITIYNKIDDNLIKKVSTDKAPNISEYRTLKNSKLQSFTTKNNFRVIRIPTHKNNIYIEAATTLNDKIKPGLAHLKDILLFLMPMLLIFSIFIGYIIIKYALMPVKKIINEVKNIESSELKKNIKSYTSCDEIEELVQTFNFLLNKLDDSFLKVKRFSKDVSHELKTPLTIIRGEIELGLRKERTNEEYKEILINTLEETKSLQELIDSLLFLSKSNNDDIKDTFEDIEFDEVVIEVLSQNKALIKEKNINFIFKKLDSVKCKGHEFLLKILVSNLIQNAIKYSDKDSKIEISLENDYLKIKDYGIGIKGNEIENIFDRFYRADKSRVSSGHGLGLSIVKSIASIHNFEITVESEYSKYSEFTLTLK